MLVQMSNKYLEVIVSTYGGELQSIKDAAGCQYLWQGDNKYWTDRAPNLFPYIARLTQGQYLYKNQRYHMKIHGFVPYSELFVIEKTNTKVIFELTSNEELKKQYPFDFSYQIIYELKKDILEITYKVLNMGNHTMYFGLGGHPGFQIPLEEGKLFEDYYLQFNQASNPVRVGFSKECFVNGKDETFMLDEEKRLWLTHSLFDEDAIVLKNMGYEVSLQAKKGKKKIGLLFPKMQYFGIWHMPHTDAPYVCLEPWSSLPSRDGIIEDLEKQEQLIALPSGDSYTNTWTIRCYGN